MGNHKTQLWASGCLGLIEYAGGNMPGLSPHVADIWQRIGGDKKRGGMSLILKYIPARLYEYHKYINSYFVSDWKKLFPAIFIPGMNTKKIERYRKFAWCKKLYNKFIYSLSFPQLLVWKKASNSYSIFFIEVEVVLNKKVLLYEVTELFFV